MSEDEDFMGMLNALCEEVRALSSRMDGLSNKPEKKPETDIGAVVREAHKQLQKQPLLDEIERLKGLVEAHQKTATLAEQRIADAERRYQEEQTRSLQAAEELANARAKPEREFHRRQC